MRVPMFAGQGKIEFGEKPEPDAGPRPTPGSGKGQCAVWVRARSVLNGARR